MNEHVPKNKQERERRRNATRSAPYTHARRTNTKKKKHNYYYAVLGKSTSTKKQKKGDEDSASIPITFARGMYDGGVQKQLNRRTRVALSLWKWDVPYMSSARNDRNFLSIFLNLTQCMCGYYLVHGVIAKRLRTTVGGCHHQKPPHNQALCRYLGHAAGFNDH